eukprot:6029112-Alexandrium_andersonii.AAC.1
MLRRSDARGRRGLQGHACRFLRLEGKGGRDRARAHRTNTAFISGRANHRWRHRASSRASP